MASTPSTVAAEVADAASAAIRAEDSGVAVSSTTTVSCDRSPDDSPTQLIPSAIDVAAESFSSVTSFSCAICFNQHFPSTIATVNMCVHGFCFGCIENWTSIAHTCPLCRSRVSAITFQGVTIPVKPLKIRINVSNLLGWNVRFRIGTKATFVSAIIDVYENLLGDGTLFFPGSPEFHFDKDVVFYYNDMVIGSNATPNKLGMKDGDELIIRHKVQVMFNMPDNSWEFVQTWWDSSIGSLLEGVMSKFDMNADDYWFVHNNMIIDNCYYDYDDTTLYDVGVFGGDVIRVFTKRDVTRLKEHKEKHHLDEYQHEGMVQEDKMLLNVIRGMNMARKRDGLVIDI